MATVLATKAVNNSLEEKIDEIKNEVTRLVSTNISQITIKRNDTMKVKIDEIINSLENGKCTVLIAKGEAISKLVSIVEIVKKKKETLMQYNKLSQVTERARLRNVSEESDKKNDLIEAADHVKVQVKVVLSTILTADVKKEHKGLEENGWNVQ